MEIIKGFLLLLLFGTSSIIGILCSKKYINRVADLREMKNALNLLETKMKFTYEPISEIFMEISENVKENIGDIFKNATEQMKEKTAEYAWESSLENINTNLKKEDINVVKRLGKMLGKTDIEGQVKQIELVSIFLDTQIQEAEEEKNKNAKMYRTLGMITGLALVIVLI